MSDNSTLNQALQQAARDLRKRDEQTTVRYEHVDAIQTAGGDLPSTMGELLRTAPADHVASFVHLARLLKVEGIGGAIAEAAMQRPSPLEAKSAAVRALGASGTAVPEAVTGLLEQAEAFVAAPDSDGLDRVLEMPDAWRQPVLDAWVTDSLASTPDLADEAVGRGAIECVDVVARLGSAGDASAVPLLQRHADGDDRDLAKAAKRALHQLRVRGVDVVESTAPTGGFSMDIAPDVEGDSLAYVTGVDGLGGRILWLLCPSERGGYRLLEAVLDDVHGIRKAEVLNTTRGEFRQHMSRLGDNDSVLVAKVAPASAAFLLRAGERFNVESSTELPADYSSFQTGPAESLFKTDSDWDEKVPAAPEEEDARRELLRDAVELLGTPPFANWAILGEASERAARAVRAAETSDLLVDDDQRKQQVDTAVASVGESFDATERGRFRSRLHEMARVLATTGDTRGALWARVAGDGFETVEDLYADHPFARAIIQRGVMTAYQQVRDSEPPATEGASAPGVVQP
ncbi:MAG: hypothetical protein GKS06_16185 [Acidobacteria bacterium]|nr:hypothetical protein [Acidobacteriota bacterium]